jgi:hypothetical protein
MESVAASSASPSFLSAAVAANAAASTSARDIFNQLSLSRTRLPTMSRLPASASKNAWLRAAVQPFSLRGGFALASNTASDAGEIITSCSCLTLATARTPVAGVL